MTIQSVSQSDLTPAGGCLLEFVYSEFSRSGEWPASSLVELELEDILENEGGLVAVANDIGTEMIRCERPESLSSKCILTLRGIARCADSEKDIELFLGMARLAGRTYRGAKGRDANLTEATVRAEMHLDDAGIRRLDALVRVESGFWTSGGGGNYSLSRFAARLEKVRSLDDYFAQRQSFWERENKEREVERQGWARATRAETIRVEVDTAEVFLSHAAADAPLADLLRTALMGSRADLRVFVASRPGDIAPGEDWLESIRGKLKSATSYVILLTPRSVTRPWVWFETGAAWMTGKRVIPVVAGIDKLSIPLPLSAQQAVDICDPDDLRELATVLGGNLRDAAGACRLAATLLRTIEGA